MNLTALTEQDFQKVCELSPTEYQTFLVMADGLSTKEVASRLFRSTKTIDSHLMRCKQKLGLPHCHALRCFAARFVERMGKPQLSKKRIVRDFVYETTKG